MSRFKERLWQELVRDHGEELAGISAPARHGRMARPRLLAGTTAGLAAMGTALALGLGAASSTPAFAVSQNHDGTVSIVIKRFDAIHGVNARLAQLGLRARFVQVAAGCAAPRAMATAHVRVAMAAHFRAVTVTQGFLHARFDPRKIPAGRTLVLAAQRVGEEIKAGPVHTVAGAPPACLPIVRAGMGQGIVWGPPTGPPVRCAATVVHPFAERARSVRRLPPPVMQKAGSEAKPRLACGAAWAHALKPAESKRR